MSYVYYFHPEDPAGYLKPGDTLMSGGYDFSWCYVNYRDAIGYPGYRVGDNGTSWSCIARRGVCQTGVIGDQWHRLSPYVGPRGHLMVELRPRRRRFIHSLVLEAFGGPCPAGLECRHLDGNPANNRPWNLKWGTYLENRQDMVNHGRAGTLKGERCSWATLTQADVVEILILLRDGKRIIAIAHQFHVNKNTIRSIATGRTWKSVSGFVDGKSSLYKPRKMWGKATAMKVAEMHRAGARIVDIARQLGLTSGLVSYIVSGRGWTQVTGLPRRAEGPR